MTNLGEASNNFMVAAQRTNTLYELSDQYLTLVALLEDPEADQALVEQELERIGGEIKTKAEAIGGLIAWYEGLAGLRRAEAKRMADSVQTFDNKATWLRQYVLQHMQALGIERIDTGRFTLAVKQNPPRVEVLEPMMIPSEFNRTKITVEPDKPQILRHYKESGEIVPGVEITRTKRLEIR